MNRLACRRGAGLFLPLALAILVAGCAGRSVSSSAQDATLVTQPPPAAPEQPREQPIESARESVVEQPPAAEPQAPPAEPGKPSEPVAESTLSPKPAEETRTTEPEVAPPAVQEKPAEVAAVAPPAVSPPPVEPMSLADVFFDFDKFTLRDDAKPRLEDNAARLKAQDGWKLLIEGHCDERGTSAYNLVLGERRAQATRDYLANLGLPASLMKVTSFGKERPFCTEHSQACWQQNRRAHFVMEK